MNTLIRLYFIEYQDNCAITHINSKYINESFLAFYFQQLTYLQSSF